LLAAKLKSRMSTLPSPRNRIIYSWGMGLEFQDAS
jgi:hypothetical protein